MRYYASIPNILTIVRIALTPLLLFCIFSGGWYIGLGLLTFIIAALTDYYDGYFARYFSVQSDFGRFLDPLADKILILSTFSAFAFLSIIPWWMVVCIGLRDGCVTLLRIFLSRQRVVLRTSRLGKWKTAMQLTSVFIILAVWFALWLTNNAPASLYAMQRVGSVFYVIMFIVTAFTTISGMLYILRYWQDVKQLLRTRS